MAQERLLMKGTEAIAEAAIRAGCNFFFGYPITPQNEIPEYMSRRMPQVGGLYLQAESEVSAINMLYGAGGSGVRVMTSSSSPGVALMSEGFSYIIGSELPVVVVNIMRGGPGLGDIAPSQGDYAQMTKGFGHGDKHAIVLAPSTVQEAVDMMALAFDLADEYRNPVVLIGDGLIGQMMEPVVFPATAPKQFDKSWAATGHKGKDRKIIHSLYLEPEELERHVLKLFRKFDAMEAKEQRHEMFMADDDPPIMICAYGTTARIAKTAMRELRKKGIKVGLFRPITAWPFPNVALEAIVDKTRSFLCIEMNMGQMIDDVRMVVRGRRPVSFYGRTGGVVPTVEEIVKKVIEHNATLGA
ncbi:MAG: 3-methyl-2-oxobutanoate dehydrogenase subunit VorB [Deltaproteobacteria bacterium]|nr:3-methyl-2-oxobutanoate dehydrogenase subunit VorB [Deltaproteobacteria bacterium]